MNASQEIEQLRTELERHNRLYYLEAEPEISDFEFDQKMRRLQELEAAHPELHDANSPSVRVGGAPVGEFAAVLHEPPMLSIENAYSLDELRSWDERVRKGLGASAVEYEVELKIDGVSISLLYENGRLTRGATRGDGARGDDVTHNVRTVRGLPLIIDPRFERLEARGEIYIAKDDFLRINEELEEAGEEMLANPRNTAAGSLRQKDPRLAALRRLRVFLYHLVTADNLRIASQWESYELLTSLGLPVNPQRELCATLEEVEAFIDRWRQQRYELPFEIDGIVVKVNRRDQQIELGATSKAPRWVVAYKYPPEAAKTVIREIRLQVGRTGTITPVAIFDQVDLAGSRVTNATLHNFDEIGRKDVRIGDTVLVEKGGDIIPKVTEVVLSERPAGSVAFEQPTECPECSQPLNRFEGEVALRCVNQGCPAIMREALLHFASRKAMDIEGIGEKSVTQFIAANLVRDYSSLYELRVADVAKLDRWGETSADKLIRQIEASKHKELSRLIFALGIRFVGERAAKLLAKRFESIEALMDATTEQLIEVSEIGPSVAESVTFYFAVEANRARIMKMLQLGLAPSFTSSVTGSRLAGKNIVVTGTLVNHSREEIHRMIEREGGKPSGSVSSKTAYLVAGDAAGSKLDKAKALGVPVLSEAEFLAMVGG